MTEQNDLVKKILVLSGGGVKGIAHIGAMQALHDIHLLKNIQTIAGSSVGALIGFLYNIGYKPSELLEFVQLFDLQKIQGFKLGCFLEKFCFDECDKIIVVLIKMMQNKG